MENSSREARSQEVLRMLARPVSQAFLEKFGVLTEPQIESIPKILGGANLLLMAPTGTGKTEAALLPALSKMMLSPSRGGVRLLYVTPLRALNRDLLDRIGWWASRLDLEVAVRHGDTATRERRTQTLSPPDILITTPETLQILLTAKVFGQYLRSVEYVVVDEVHELATDKRGAQLSVALERLEAQTGRPFQRIGLSATIGSPGVVAAFLSGVGRSCEIVRVPVARSLDITVIYPQPTDEDYSLSDMLSITPEVASRLAALRRLVESHESTLIFTNTRPLAEILTNRFRAWDEDILIGIHHGSLARPTRIGAEQALKTGKLLSVICTSSLEMGIDVGRVDLCVQYNSPREVTRLVQRIGRSGHRVGGLAKGVVVVMDSDDALESLAIARRAYQDEIERVEIPKGSYDVLMHQLAGMLIEGGDLEVEQALRLLRKSYCFDGLTEDDLIKVARHMDSLGVAHLTADLKTIARPPRSSLLFDYYFGNLSMIPEEKQYLVVSETNGEPVGILDEEFVAEHGTPGTRFILMGKAWDIIQASGERIFVAPQPSLEGAVPSWVGDEIPVPLEVAEEVGRIRRVYASALAAGEGHSTIDALASEYRTEAGLLRQSLREVEEHMRMDIPVPSDRLAVLEEAEKVLVLHICGGLKANRTIARMLAFEMSKQVGAPVTIQQDPYRIVFRSENISPSLVLKTIDDLVRRDWGRTLTEAVASSSLFRRRLVHAARKMGVIGKEASILDISAEKLAETLKETVVFEEALRFTLFQDFSADEAFRLLQDIADGELRVEVLAGEGSPSPLARLTLRRHEYDIDVIASDRIHRLVANAVRSRLSNEVRTLVCASCFEYWARSKVKDLEESPTCPVCGSKSIGVLSAEPEEVYGLVARKGRPVGRRERELRRETIKTSKLVEAYGKAAVFVLASKYVDYKVASQILGLENRVGMRLVELVIEEEKKALQRLFR